MWCMRFLVPLLTSRSNKNFSETPLDKESCFYYIANSLLKRIRCLEGFMSINDIQFILYLRENFPT